MNVNNQLAAKLAEEFWLRKLAGIEDRAPLFPYRADVYPGRAETGALAMSVPMSVVDIMNRMFTGEKGPANKFLVYQSVLKILYRAYTGCADMITGVSDLTFSDVSYDPYRLIFLRSSWENKNDSTFRGFLQQEQHVLLAALENQVYDFPVFLEKYRLNHPNEEQNLFYLGLFYNRFNYPSKQWERFEVMVSIIEPGENDNPSETKLEVRFPGQVDPARVRLFMQNYIHTLAYVLENRDTKLAEIPIISAEEKALINNYSAPDVEFLLEKTVPDLFREQSDKSPDAVAVVDGNRQLTYRELSTRSINVGKYLSNRFDLHAEDIVGIMMERSDDMVIVVIGVLMAGCAYVFIDPAYPPERVRFIIEDTACKTVVSESMFKENSERYGRVETPNPTLSLDNTAFIIYTSGSTGIPKGILQTHRCLANVVLRQAYHGGFEKNLRVLQFSSAGFDVFIAHELFFSLLTGGRLEIIGEAEKRDLPFLGKFIMQRNIQWLLLPVTVLNIIFDLCEGLWGAVAIKHIIGTGEKLRLTPLLIRYLEQHHTVRLHNFYGPAETHNASNYTLPPGCITIEPPIGRPSTNTWIYILNNDYHIVPIGVPGEIYIAGAGVAKGYLNHPELTAKKFIDLHHPSFIHHLKLYRTGDLARWQPDGNIEFLGRLDHQVKIRGIRIEPGEIETQLTTHENVKEAIVMVRENDAGEKYLCAYIVFRTLPSSGVFDLQELRNYLAKKLPDYMIPTYFVPLETLPLNPSGKIDRKALPEPKTAETSPDYMAPRDKIEQTMIRLWAEVLEIDPGVIGIDDHFFQLGGHSLKAAIVLSRIHKELNVKIAFSEIFRNPTVRLLGDSVRGAEFKPYIEIEPVEQKEYYELSHAQRRLWILDQIDKENIAYNMPGSFEFDTMNEKAFERSVEALIKRHESLRTTFITIAGKPKQKIHDYDALGFRINYIDLRNKKNQAETVKALKEKEMARPFNLEKGPLLRVNLPYINDNRCLLLFTMHHIISDGWSVKILENELVVFYNAYCREKSPSLPPLKIHYKDFAVWHNRQIEGQTFEKHREYWTQKFSGQIPVLDLKTDFPRPAVNTFRGGYVQLNMESEIKDGLKKLCRENDTGMAMLLAAILKTLLYRYTNQEDIVIGLPVAGREQVELQNQVGFYINMLPLRTTFSGKEESFAKLLARVKHTILKAFEHQSYPFDRLIADLELERNRGRFPLFDVVFQYLNFEGIDVASNQSESSRGMGGMDGVNVNTAALDLKTSKFDLTWNFSESPTALTGIIIYNTDIFQRESIIIMAEKFKLLAREIIAFPGGCPANFEINLELEKKLKKVSDPHDFGFDYEL
ncbi:MAG TPA: amino acid adenylation domain-containing protein [Candidatus Deferrimicrobium sp.]|nr:amino acid adenylation domain-containing protein [Candidatus Deferrimicrobium sp.]